MSTIRAFRTVLRQLRSEQLGKAELSSERESFLRGQLDGIHRQLSPRLQREVARILLDDRRALLAEVLEALRGNKALREAVVSLIEENDQLRNALSAAGASVAAALSMIDAAPALGARR